MHNGISNFFSPNSIPFMVYTLYIIWPVAWPSNANVHFVEVRLRFSNGQMQGPLLKMHTRILPNSSVKKRKSEKRAWQQAVSAFC